MVTQRTDSLRVENSIELLMDCSTYLYKYTICPHLSYIIQEVTSLTLSFVTFVVIAIMAYDSTSLSKVLILRTCFIICYMGPIGCSSHSASPCIIFSFSS